MPSKQGFTYRQRTKAASSEAAFFCAIVNKTGAVAQQD
jgi:hypothetical protein